MRGISTGARLLAGLILVIGLLSVSAFSGFAQEKDDPSPTVVVDKSDEATPDATEDAEASDGETAEEEEAAETDEEEEEAAGETEDVEEGDSSEAEDDAEAAETEDEASETEEGEDEDFAAAVVTDEANYSVAVSCSYDSGTDQSSCVFEAVVENDDAPVDALTVLYDTVCSEALDSGGAEETDTGYRFAAASGTIVLVGEVIPFDVATYSVEADGTTFDAGGSALACALTDEIVGVAVYKYNCPADPGAVVPGTLPGGCEAGAGVSFGVTDDGGDPLGTITTDDNGLAVIEVPVGTSLVFTEFIPPGWEPLGSGTASVVAEEGAAVAFVNVPGATLQIGHGSCPTAGESWTEFVGIGPHPLSGAEGGPGCESVGGGTFVIHGGDLEPAGLTITTDENGDWIGPLTPGTYTITGGVVGAKSDPFEVELSSITIVLVIDHVEFTGGALRIERQRCIGDPPGTTIGVGVPAGNGGVCAPSDGQFQLNDASPFSIGADGLRVMEVPVGDYVLTDLTSGESVEVSVTADQQVQVGVTQLELGGAVNFQFLSCGTPVTVAPNPAAPAYWDASCVTANVGATVRLLNGAGGEVASGATDGAGQTGWANLLAGNYSVSAPGACAVFVGASNAAGGFPVAAGQTTNVRLFTCPNVVPPPDDETSGAGEDPPGDGGNNGSNTNTNTAVVTTLPQTGSGAGAELGMSGATLPMLLGLALVAAGGLGGVYLRRRRAA